jgi:hypothetical protein
MTGCCMQKIVTYSYRMLRGKKYFLQGLLICKFFSFSKNINMNCRSHWIALVINISLESVYVFNPVNHDVNGLRI